MKHLRSILHPVINLLISSGMVVLCTAILVLLRPYLSVSVVALLYLIPVVISAALLGRVAGITSSVLSFLIFNYFFISPYYTFQATHPQDYLAMLVFLSVAIFISSLMSRFSANLERVQAREREVVQLYELSIDLAGKKDHAAIAAALAKRLADLFKTTLIEVDIELPEGTIRAYEPDDRGCGAGDVFREIPMSSPRGRLGIIRIWGLPETLDLDEARLLETIVSQGALALDRAYLADSETRARVLEESDRLKTAILSSVSHELRTPLAAIEAAATSLFHPDVTLEPAARSELQSLLLEETDTLTQLVGNLLNMSRIEAGALKLQRQWNSISEIVDTGLRRLRRSLGAHTFEVDVSDDLPLVLADSVLMEQVVTNLARNSLKFAPPNTPIRISADVLERDLKVTVSNLGPPIPPEHLSHIFEKFYPIPGRDSSQGTGLGLSICKGIVEAHDGKIWAANLPVGVAFQFTLPLTGEQSLPVIADEENESL